MRATEAETNLSNALDDEITRAENSEAELQANLDEVEDNLSVAIYNESERINDITLKIPNEASENNQLADKNFVNSSIATETATFRGTYNSIQDLPADNIDNNDYAFVISADASGNTLYNRYKYVDRAGWTFEYALNNSSFTAEQWAAINSGATTDLISQISLNTTNRHTHDNKTILDNTTASYTTDQQTKLGNIESGAQVNVQSDWGQSNTTADDYIKNKPNIPTNTSDLNNDSDFIDSSALNGYATESWVEEQGYSTFDGDYNSLENKPELADIATSGSYNDLSDTPDLSDYARKDELSSVATSGDYDDLYNTPEIPEVYGDNDGDYWTSLTIDGDTYNIPSGSNVSGYYNDNDYWTSLRIGDQDHYLAPVVSGTNNNKIWTSLTIADTTYDLALPGVKIPSNENELNLFDKKTWYNAPYNFYAVHIWTDDDDIYYSAGYGNQYKLNKSTDTWEARGTGISNLDGWYVWKDNDNNIYYSNGKNEQYKWNKLTHTWTAQTWEGLTDFKGLNVWTDGTNIYYSDYSSSGGNKQYVLNGSTWSVQSWGEGFNQIKGQYVWTDGDNTYYSENSSNQYVLDKENLTWNVKTWTNLPGNFYGNSVWTDGHNYYTYSTPDSFVLDKTNSTWLTKNWYGVNQISAQLIWKDGDKIYYSTSYQLNNTYHIAETLTKVAETGDYNDLINKPDIPTVPTNISAFTNDIGYLTANDIPANLGTRLNTLETDMGNTLSALDTLEDDMGKTISTLNEICGFVPRDAAIDNKFATEAFVIDQIKVTDVKVNNTSVLNNTVAEITVPTNTSDLTNDSGFITNSALTGYATETYVNTAISGLSIPTKTSDLTNDSDFITIADVPVPTPGTGINILNGQISVDNTVVTKDTDGNVEALYLSSITSVNGTDTDCKSRVNLSSGIKKGTVTLVADGEGSEASIEVKGSASEDDEGTVTIIGDVTIDSNTRPKVGTGANQKQIAYLSDISTPSVYEYVLQFSTENLTFNVSFISTDGNLIDTSVPENFSELINFIKTYGMEYPGGQHPSYSMRGHVEETLNIKYCVITAHNNGTTDTLQYASGSTYSDIASTDIFYEGIHLYKRQC